MNVIQEQWDEILNTVKREHELSDVSFNTWLAPLTIHEVDEANSVVTVVVPSKQIGLDYISKKYTLPLQVAIGEVTGIINWTVQFILEKDVPAPKEASSQDTNATRVEEAGLIPKYTFDTFVVGGNNRFAHAASLAVAAAPGEIYTPLFIYGGVGLGKTHLMHSIAHFVIDASPQSRVLYVTSEVFTNELIDSIKNSNNMSMSKFRDKYRNNDVLLIDDVQFIIGKESTQEEFFHTFNALHSAKKQIVISSDKPPKDMEILEDRIRSRFEWGLIADISTPDYETRMAILRKKEEMDGYHLDDEVIEYIASNVKSNIRELEGALNKIKAFGNLEKGEATLPLVEQILKDIISPEKKKAVTPDYIINVVAEHFDVSIEDIKSNKRSSRIVFPRQIAMYLCRDLTDNSLKAIGQYIGNRDHTTVKHGIEKIEKEVEKSPTTQNTIEILKKKINPPK